MIKVNFSYLKSYELSNLAGCHSAFGPSGEHYVRMAYCVDEDTINLAFGRIELYFKG